MDILDYFYQNPPKLENFIPRKQSIEFKKTLLKGPMICGKTSLVLDFLNKFDRFLYINLGDIRLLDYKFLANLIEFIKTKQIKTICIDEVQKFDFLDTDFVQNLEKNCENIVFITNQNDFEINGFENLNLHGLDYEEFIAFYHKNYGEITLFSHFLALGNSPKSAFLNSNNEYLNAMLKSRFDELEIKTLAQISEKISKPFNAYEIFKKLKQTNKISKDRFYANLINLEKCGVISFASDLSQKAKFRRIFFSDFALKSVLGFEKNPNATIANMVFCELRKLGVEIKFSEFSDFLLPNLHQAIIIAPFLPNDLAILRIKKQIKHFLDLGIHKITIISNSGEIDTAFEGIKIVVMPFWHWAAGISA